MSTASISHQIARCLDQLFLTKEEIDRRKEALGVTSLKRALRPGGDPTRPIQVMFSVETYRTYFTAARACFRLAQKMTGKRLLKDLLQKEILLEVYEEHYSNCAPGTISKLQCAIKKVYAGAVLLGWVKGACPIENEFRDRMEQHFRPPRYGYTPRDALRIIDYLVERRSRFALPAKLSLYCGLRENEDAGLRGEHIDRERQLLCITGKNGRYREVPIPARLLPELTRTTGYLFTPSRSWRSAFRQASSNASKALKIEDSGVHRLRATYAQLVYTACRNSGWEDGAARDEVARLLGHGRREVSFHYVPEGFEWQLYTDYTDLIS